MPLFKFRLEAKGDSGHFRSGTTEAPDKETAEAKLKLDELTRVAYRKTTAELAQIAKETLVGHDGKPPPEKAAIDIAVALQADDIDFRDQAFKRLPARLRAVTTTHHQSEPFELVLLEEVK